MDKSGRNGLLRNGSGNGLGSDADGAVDITLAEVSGQAWLVRGEQHIDDLLNNTLDPDISIEVVACESKLDVDALWSRWSDAPTAEMWLIHPGILKRVKGGAPAGSVVVFPPWSAALDAAALHVVAATAAAANARPEAQVALVRHVLPGAARASEDLGGLRCMLLEGRLVEAGVAAGRLQRETTPAGSEAEAERIDLLLR